MARMVGFMSRLAPLLMLVYVLIAASRLVESALKIYECHDLDYLRSPKRVQPEHYNLELLVDPDAAVFRGEVTIDVKHHKNWDNGLCDKMAARGLPISVACHRSTIVLGVYHTMQIDSLEYKENGRAIKVLYTCRSKAQDLLVFGLNEVPEPGSGGQIKIGYRNAIRDDKTGLFRANYRDSKTGKIKNVTATQFEPAYARRAFPCFDEPDFKATFELAVYHPTNLEAISNTPVKHVEERAVVWPNREFSKTYFARTPRMSAYLLALAVGEFDYIESKVSDKMTLRMYTPPGRAEEARDSMETAVQAYKAIEDFFGIEQPLEKLDFVSIRDFPTGMENWGMIVFETELLLNGREELDALWKNYARDSLIHEISHQWFGNLVTMRWWDDLWLNEGFAQWMGTEISQQLYPNVGAESIWMFLGRRQALTVDADPKRTHAIKNSALQTVDEIKGTFDAITYHKGQAIVRMLEMYLGHEMFQKGLRFYFEKHAFGNTEDTDLWSALSEVSGDANLDVRGIMHSWVHKPGFPLISVSVRGNKLNLRQTRFGVPPSEGQHDKWSVPIVMWISDGEHRPSQMKFLFDFRAGSVQLPDWFDLNKPGHWLKLNVQSMGFYYVQYDSKLYSALRKPIETKTMSPVDRYNFLEENFGQLKARTIRKDQFLTLLSWYQNEDDDAVVALICLAIQALRLNYANNELIFASLVSHLERHGLGDENTSGDNVNLMKLHARGAALSELVEGNYKPAVKSSIKLFAKTNGQVPTFLRDGVYLAVGLAGSDEQFKQVVKLVSKIKSSPQRKHVVLQLLNASRPLAEARVQMVKALQYGMV